MLCLLFLIFGTLYLPWTSLLGEGHKALLSLSAWPTQSLLTTRHVCEAIQDIVLNPEPPAARWPLELLRGSQAPRRAVCGTRGSLRTMHRGGSAPSCCAFTHRVAFEEGFRPPGSQASSRGEAKDSALLSSRDAGLLEPPEQWRS